MKKIKISLRILGIVVLLVFLFGNYYGPRMIIEIDNDIFKILRSKPVTKKTAEDFDLQSEKMDVITDDGFVLKTELISARDDRSKGTIIFVHGIRAYKEHYLPLCKFLSDNGYNSVLIDLRAHGQSEGKYCTFGFKEKYDLVHLMDTLDNISDLNHDYGIWGQSLGAAVALQTLAVDERLKFGIIESTFTDFETIVQDYSTHQFGFRFGILNKYLIWRAEHIGDFDADEIKPCESAKSIKQRILMVHGKKDKRIKFEYGVENYNNLATKDKEFIEYSDANHLNVWKVGGDAYFQRVLEFIERG